MPLAGFYYCPHHPDGSVDAYAVDLRCRKPAPGMLSQAAREHGVDLARSWMVGDILHDVEAGRRPAAARSCSTWATRPSGSSRRLAYPHFTAATWTPPRG